MRTVEWAPVSVPAVLPPFGAAFESHLAAYQSPAVYAASAAAWELLYQVLRKHSLPIGTVVFGEHGKPYFPDSGVFFSISHAGDVVAVSVADTPTGVDIERCDRAIRSQLIERCLSEREKQTFDGDFLRIWCRKESIVKLTGDGLYGYPDRIESDDGRYDICESLVKYHDIRYRLTAAFAKTDMN